MISNNHQNKIIFYFCVPCQIWKKIQALSISRIGCLTKLIKNYENNYIFIYNQCIVDPNSTFQFIGIVEESVLYAFRNENNLMNNITADMKMMKLLDTEWFIKKLKIMSNENCKYEYNRMCDIKYMKIEGSIKLYKRQIHKKIIYENDQTENQNRIDLKIDYEPLSTPCIEAMPILW